MPLLILQARSVYLQCIHACMIYVAGEIWRKNLLQSGQVTPYRTVCYIRCTQASSRPSKEQSSIRSSSYPHSSRRAQHVARSMSRSLPSVGRRRRTVPPCRRPQPDECHDQRVNEQSQAAKVEISALARIRSMVHAYLNMMRIYVTWSIPSPDANRSSSSVADMNSTLKTRSATAK